MEKSLYLLGGTIGVVMLITIIHGINKKQEKERQKRQAELDDILDGTQKELKECLDIVDSMFESRKETAEQIREEFYRQFNELCTEDKKKLFKVL